MGTEISFYRVFVTIPSFIFGQVLSISRSSPILGFNFSCESKVLYICVLGLADMKCIRKVTL